MKFKAGDRVHVTRYQNEKEDFYATLENIIDNHLAKLTDCTNEEFEGIEIYLPDSNLFGRDKTDFFRPLINLSEEQKNKKVK